MLLSYLLPLPITAGWSILVCAKEKMLYRKRLVARNRLSAVLSGGSTSGNC